MMSMLTTTSSDVLDPDSLSLSQQVEGYLMKESLNDLEMELIFQKGNPVIRSSIDFKIAKPVRNILVIPSFKKLSHTAPVKVTLKR